MTNRLQDLTDWDVTICARCGEEIAVFAARFAGPELPTWEGATLCNECYAAEIAAAKERES